MRPGILLLTVLTFLGCASEPPSEAVAAGSVLLASQKAAKSLAWYTLDGELLHEVSVSDHPHEFVRSADGTRLYMTDNGVMQIENRGEGGNKVSIIDLDGRERIGEIDLGTWHRPHGIDLCPDGRLLVTTENPDQLLVIDIESKTIIKEYETGGQTPHIVHCSPDSTTAYVSNARSGTVAKIDLESGERQLVKTGDRPEGSTLSADGSTLYVAHRDADKIVVIDTADWRVLDEIETGNGPVRVAVAGDGTTLAYALFGGAAVGFADLEKMEETGQVKLVGPGVSLEMLEDGVTALSCAQQHDTCYVIDVPAKAIRHTVEVVEGAAPDPALLLD